MSKPSPFTVTKDGLSYRVELDVHYISEAEMQTLRRYITTLNDENEKLRELVRDYVNAPCTTCDCWDDNFRCWNYDGADCGLVARARELGVEVDG